MSADPEPLETQPATPSPGSPATRPVSTGRTRWRIIVVIALVLGLGGAGLLGYGLGAQQPSAPQPPAAAGPPDTASPASTAGAATAPPGTGGGPAVMAAATPTAISIPAIGVSSPLGQVGLNPDHTIEVPAPGPHYDQPAWYRYSPTPGQLGPAVILGHIDSAKNGPSVFFKLGALKPGQQIQVARADHSTASFTIDSLASYPKTAFPTTAVYGNTTDAALRLITCGGTFDDATGSYENNTVVYAHLNPPPPPAAGTPATGAGPRATPGAPTGPPTLYGRVVDVPDPATVVVDVAGTPLRVGVLGIDPAVPACAAGDAAAFARRTLDNQQVTLVPDPTLPTPATGPPGSTWRAYVVLGSQLSYTDAAIQAGWAAPGNGLYRPVFDREAKAAQNAGAGMWGPPCHQPAP